MNKHWLMMLALLSPACKDSAPNDKSGPEDPQPVAVAATAEVQPTEEDVDEPNTLGETPLVLFDTKTGEEVVASWAVGDETMLIEAREYSNGDRSLFQVDIYGSVPENDNLKFHTCADLKSASAGRVELLLRGDKLHVLCINPPHGEESGWTEAVRMRYSSDTHTMVAAGNYSGEGIVDPDTIELDEGELTDMP